MLSCSFGEIGHTYGYVWDEWLPSSPHAQDNEKLSFDFHPPGTTDGTSPMEIWIPVHKTG